MKKSKLATVIHTTSARYPSAEKTFFYESKGLVDLGGTDGVYSSNELEVLLPDGRMLSMKQYLNSWGKKFLTPAGIVDGYHRPVEILVGLIPAERRWDYE